MAGSPTQGFTAVELLVAIIVGVTLLGAAYQLYSVALSSSGDAQRRSKASNVAYDLLRTYQANSSYITTPCAAKSASPAIPSDSGLTNATASIAITCPYSVSSLSLITATVSYDSPNTKQVVRAITVTP